MTDEMDEFDAPNDGGPTKAHPVDELIEQQHALLVEIRLRVAFLQRVSAELKHRTKGKGYRRWNELVPTLLGDTFCAVFIKLADWALTQVNTGKSVFVRLHAQYPKEFRRKRKRGDGESRWTREDDDASHAATYDRLFPDAGPYAQPKDIEHLRQRFEARLAPILAHRNKRIAHFRDAVMKSEPIPPAVSLDEVANALAEFDAIYNDLRGLVGGPFFVTDYIVGFTNMHTAAEELVDSILLHPMIAERSLKKHRLAIYEELHRRHDESSPKRIFNLDPLADWSLH